MRLDKDDVFAQALKSPESVKLLFNCLQSSETEMKTVKEISLAVKEWQIKGTEQLNCKEDQDVRESKGTAWIFACMVTRW